MKLNHKQKKKLAIKLNETPIYDKDGKIIGNRQLQTGNFLTRKWEERKQAIANRVKKPNSKEIK